MKNESNFLLSDVVLALFIFLGFSLMIISCSKDQAEPKKEDPKVDKVTYDNFVGALFQSKCTACHGVSGPNIANWAFTGYQSAKDNETKLRNVLLVAQSMPQGGSITASEKEKLKNWFDNGTPEK